jgi:peptide/nickel transport system substrate-binding protein
MVSVVLIILAIIVSGLAYTNTTGLKSRIDDIDAATGADVDALGSKIDGLISADTDLAGAVIDIGSAVTDLGAEIGASADTLAAIEARLKALEEKEEPPITEGQTIIFGMELESQGFHPNLLAMSSENHIMDLMNDGLLRFQIRSDGRMSTETEPGLAESYTISEDGLTYTFKIRSGQKFHDGEPINAAAFKHTWDAFMIEDHALAPLNGAHNWYGGYYGEGFIDSTEVIDDMTFAITLTGAYAPIESLFAAYFSSVISPKALQELGADGYHNNPIGGAGPFKFVEWVRGNHVALEANDEYYRGAPKLEKVIFRWIPDPATRFLALKQGEIDAMYGISPTDIPEARQDSNLNVLKEAMIATGYIYVNTDSGGPLDDVLVRRALAYATDRETLIDELYGEMGIVANQLLPKGLWPWSEDQEWYPYDLEMAKDLLEQAGYSEENPCQITIYGREGTRTYKPAGLEEDIAMAAMWEEAGFEVELEIYESTILGNLRRSGDYMLMHEGWTMDYADPDNYVGAALSPLKYVGWIDFATWLPVHPDNPLNVEYYELVNAAVASTSFEERVEMYERCEAIIKDQVLIIPIAYPNSVIVTGNTVHGMYPPSIYYSWDLMWMNVWLDT